MGFKSTALTALACLTLSAAACAGVQDIEFANNQVAALALYKYLNQTESVGGMALDSEDGHIVGYGLSGSAMQDLWLGHDYLNFHYGFFSGETNYKGGTQDNPVYGSLLGKSKAKIRDYSFRYGKGMVIDDVSILTPYGELGHHQYDRYLGYGTPNTYQETYTHNYFGIGILGQYSSADRLVFSAYSLVGRTFGSNIVVLFSAPYTGFSAKLGNSTLYKVAISVDYALTKNIHASLSADMTSWNYGASAARPIGNGLYANEPDSATNDTTAKIGLGFAF